MDNIDAMIEIYVKGGAHIENSYYDKVKKGQILYRDSSYVLTTRTPVKGVKQLIEVHKNKIEKIAIYFDPKGSGRQMRESLQQINHARITSSGRNNIELIGKRCSKSEALKELCKRLNLSMDQVMAVGDSENDIDMLEAAALSVAMENGEERVKEQAAYITTSNDCDGLAKAINCKVLHHKETGGFYGNQ